MKNTKRGFTIVELVIVIAVIAILAAILIPVFSSVVESANEKSRQAEIKNTFTAYTAQEAMDGTATTDKIADFYYTEDGTTFYTFDGKVAMKDKDTAIAASDVGAQVTLTEDNGWDMYKKA